MYPQALNQETFDRFNGIITKIYLISQNVIMQSDVCGGVIYMSNKSKYLKTEMRYATAVKTNLYNFKGFFK